VKWLLLLTSKWLVVARTVRAVTGGQCCPVDLERRNLAPPLVVSIAGIVPLLPGLALLHGIYAIRNDQHAVGFASVLGAMAIGTALQPASRWASGAWEGSAAPAPGARRRSRPSERSRDSKRSVSLP
jgi:uncharacterized membrane protein YjjB (DUF3815 family)